VGGALYLAAIWGVVRLGLLQDAPVSLQWIWLLLPAFLYGLFAGSWWALLGPAALAAFVLVTWTTGVENSDSTWGEAVAPVIFFPSAAAVALGVLLVGSWRELRRTRER
jgi:MFS superfamily sulfate permease-like transporter